jgi:hypothetical protein
MSDRRVGFDPNVGYTAKQYTAFINMAGLTNWRKRRDEIRFRAAARIRP